MKQSMKQKIKYFIIIISMIFGLNIIPVKAQDNCGVASQTQQPVFRAGYPENGKATTWNGIFAWQPKTANCNMDLGIVIFDNPNLQISFVKSNGNAVCSIIDRYKVRCTGTEPTLITLSFTSFSGGKAKLSIQENSSGFDKDVLIDLVYTFHFPFIKK